MAFYIIRIPNRSFKYSLLQLLPPKRKRKTESGSSVQLSKEKLSMASSHIQVALNAEVHGASSRKQKIGDCSPFLWPTSKETGTPRPQCRSRSMSCVRTPDHSYPDKGLSPSTKGLPFWRLDSRNSLPSRAVWTVTKLSKLL